MSDSESENFLTSLKDRLSPYFDEDPLQCGTERSESDSVLFARERTGCTASARQLTNPRMDNQAGSKSYSDAETQLDHTGSNDTAAHRPRRPHATPVSTRNVRSASSSSQRLSSQISSPGIPETPRVSMPISLAPSLEEAQRARPKALLKSSMKHLSNAGEIPIEPSLDSAESKEHHRTSHPLRRVKTVEFEDIDTKGRGTIPPLKPWFSDINLKTFKGHESQDELTSIKQYGVAGSVCPRPGIKSIPAEPALTKTDVHAVTLAPSFEGKVLPREPDLGTATPTMQIIKSADNSHEVVWDDVRDEEFEKVHRKTSVASRTLRTINLRTQSGLEHVNSKLNEWSSGRGSGLKSFAPQIVVSPGDEGHDHSMTSNADDYTNAATRAPFSSQRTSGNPSCSTSTPGTTWPSRPPSQYELETTDKHGVDESNNGGSMLVVPDPEAVPGGTIATLSDAFKRPLAERRLSNVDDSDMKFRGHRDSVTIARSRLVYNGGVSPELFQVKGYSRTAKKRMHARNRLD